MASRYHSPWFAVHLKSREVPFKPGNTTQELDNLIKQKNKESIVVDDGHRGTVKSSSADGFLMIFFTIGSIIDGY